MVTGSWFARLALGDLLEEEDQRTVRGVYGHRRIGFWSKTQGGELRDLGFVVWPDLPAKRGLPEPRELRSMTTVQHDLHESAHPVNATNPLLAGLDPEHGRRLAALPCDLVWATTWMAEANEVLAPRLGLPQLPVVDWLEGEDDGRRLHWKTRSLVQWAAGRRFVWVDDEITDADRMWVAAANHSAPALLHRVDPRHGLSDEDYKAIAQWLTKERRAT